jgi:hypothetical protein
MMLRTSNYASSTESIVHFGKINNAAIAELNRLGACPSSCGIFGTNLIPFEA